MGAGIAVPLGVMAGAGVVVGVVAIAVLGLVENVRGGRSSIVSTWIAPRLRPDGR